MTTKLSVLVVDDEPDKRLLLAFALENEGYEVHTAVDGVAGLAAVELYQPDLIVTDVMMPRMDGITLAKTLKNDPTIGNIPLVMLTAKSGPLDMITGINAGARHYITKPFKASDLIDKVKKALASRRGG